MDVFAGTINQSGILEIARRRGRIVMANFAGTMAVDGVVSPELRFILNSARLLPRSVGVSHAEDRSHNLHKEHS
jgi:hypothetical protein